MYIVVTFSAAGYVFVFDRIRRPGGIELDNIASPDEVQPIRPDWKRPFDTSIRPLFVTGIIDARMCGMAAHGENVLVEALFEVNQSALPRTVAVVLQSGDHDGISIFFQRAHNCFRPKCCYAALSGSKSAAFTT